MPPCRSSFTSLCRLEGKVKFIISDVPNRIGCRARFCRAAPRIPVCTEDGHSTSVRDNNISFLRVGRLQTPMSAVTGLGWSHAKHVIRRVMCVYTVLYNA